MKIILLEDVDKLGRAGDVVTVKNGYANNYLLPQKLALPDTPQNMNIVKTRRKAAAAKAAKMLEEAKQHESALQGKLFKLSVKCGEGGRLYGAVTNQDIADELAKQGFEFDKRNIELSEPLKNLGKYELNLKLHPEVSVPLNIELVEAEEKKD